MGGITASRNAFIDKWMGVKSEAERKQADDELRRFVHVQMLLILGKKPEDLHLGPNDLPMSAEDFRPATQKRVDEFNGGPELKRLKCFGCGEKMDPVPVSRGTNRPCVRCPECRWRARCYNHQKLRRRAEDSRDPGPYLKRFIGHRCTKAC